MTSTGSSSSSGRRALTAALLVVGLELLSGSPASGSGSGSGEAPFSEIGLQPGAAVLGLVLLDDRRERGDTLVARAGA